MNKPAVKKPAVKKAAQPSKPVEKPAVKKVEAQKAEVKPAAKKEQKPEEKKVNKMATAVIVFERLQKQGKQRKDIIAAFMSEVGLTKAGASTYYQTIKNME